MPLMSREPSPFWIDCWKISQIWAVLGPSARCLVVSFIKQSSRVALSPISSATSINSTQLGPDWVFR